MFLFVFLFLVFGNRAGRMGFSKPEGNASGGLDFMVSQMLQ
jgi:hypothetical protein